MRNNKKSQMEILGLAFLFVIIVFGFLFFIKLKSQSSTSDTLEEYIEPKIASAFTDMFLHTSVKCGDGDRTLKDLFINCISYDSNEREYCDQDLNLFDDPQDYDPDYPNNPSYISMDSCEIVKSYLDLAGNLTLQKWARSYYVEAYKITSSDDIDKQRDVFPSKLDNSIQFTLPDLGIKKCFYDPNGRVRSYRSRWQPLPLLTGNQVVLQTGICH